MNRIYDSVAWAWWLGFKDGFESPGFLSCGYTWQDSQDKNKAYDSGVNLGQRVGSILKRTPCQADEKVES